MNEALAGKRYLRYSSSCRTHSGNIRRGQQAKAEETNDASPHNDIEHAKQTVGASGWAELNQLHDHWRGIERIKRLQVSRLVLSIQP